MEVILYSSNKNFFKAEHNLRKALYSALQRLCNKIKSYYDVGTPFEKIMDDDGVKYDKCGNFFTYKFQWNKGGCIQVRILYHCTTQNNQIKIYLIDYRIEKNNDKSYIREFEQIAKNLTVDEILLQAKQI